MNDMKITNVGETFSGENNKFPAPPTAPTAPTKKDFINHNNSTVVVSNNTTTTPENNTAPSTTPPPPPPPPSLPVVTKLPYDENVAVANNFKDNNCASEKEIRITKNDDENCIKTPSSDTTPPPPPPPPLPPINLSNGKGASNGEKELKEDEKMEVDDEKENMNGSEENDDMTNDMKACVARTTRSNTAPESELSKVVKSLVPEDSVLVKDFDGGAEVTKASRITRQLEKIEQLKEDLRCEEATLNILRKLIESQRGKNGYKSTTKHQPPVPSLHQKPPAQIAPKVEAPKQQYQSNKSQAQPAANSAPVQKYYVQIGNQLVPAPPPGTAGSGPIYQYSNGGTPNSHSNYQPPQPPKPAPPPKQTPEQKQSAAKAALRRQLEQTLLQIPPPRPPPADWRAIPNVNSMDFMMLVGLDEVVDNILDMDSKPTLKTALEELMPYNPRICSQCRVDFSPCWKNKDAASKSKEYVLCERCALQNVKKELKAEHTSRLKSAFLKALKQEQEIEEKIKAGEDVNIGNITGSEKSENNSQSPVSVPSSCARISSPKSAVTAPSNNHAPSSNDRHHHHQSSTGGGHRLQVVQHYPHHSPLVQQLHHQHLQQQQQQLEADPTANRHSSRWHPYLPPSSGHHGHREHQHQSHHRSYVPVSSSSSEQPSLHQEYYVVHHPQHAGVRYINR